MTSSETFYPSLKNKIQKLIEEYDQISQERKTLLTQLTTYIQQKKEANIPTNLIFICTHNSRRSHISQIWAQAAATYYGIKNIFCFSGGTEATAFNPRAVEALRESGFTITVEKEGDNPLYMVRFSEEAPSVKAFSKVYNSPFNPQQSFAAIMTCSHADENCPLVTGAEMRIALSYDDPKDFDGTALEKEKYTERVNEIGREILYALSNVR